MPTREDDSKPIETRIAHNPGGRDFPFLSPRAPFGQHRFLGANTVLARLMSDVPSADDADEVGVSAVALSERVTALRRHLQLSSARVTIETPSWMADRLMIPVTVENLAGHKFPTAYPSRRAWLHLVVSDSTGTTVFSSGAVNSAGCLVDEQGDVLRCETVGGPIAPHRTQIDSSRDVQIYESVMKDPAGLPTFRLLRGAAYCKDNRLLPQGWSSAHPDAATTASVGTADDEDFRSGSDRVTYSVALSGTGPWTIQATLLYQSISARHLAELIPFDTPEVRAFSQSMTAELRQPETVAQATLSWTRVAKGADDP